MPTSVVAFLLGGIKMSENKKSENEQRQPRGFIDITQDIRKKIGDEAFSKITSDVTELTEQFNGVSSQAEKLGKENEDLSKTKEYLLKQNAKYYNDYIGGLEAQTLVNNNPKPKEEEVPSLSEIEDNIKHGGED